MEEVGGEIPLPAPTDQAVQLPQHGVQEQKNWREMGQGVQTKYQWNVEKRGSGRYVGGSRRGPTGRTWSQRGSNAYRRGQVPSRGLGRPQENWRGNRDESAELGRDERHTEQTTEWRGGIRNDHRNDDEATTRLPHYVELQELVQKDPSEVVSVVANTRKGYHNLFRGPLQPDTMVLVVKALAKVCRVDFKENKTTVLARACNAKFLESLACHVATLPTDSSPARRAGTPDFLEDLFAFCGTVLDLLPNTACEHLGPVLVLVKGAMASASAFRRVTFAKALTDRQEELEGRLRALVAERERKPAKTSGENEALRHRPPPDDFREMSVFPLAADILTGRKAFVRPNIVEGAYDSVDHYLDVQFRLLREDFVWPLREGIADHLRRRENAKRANGVRVHRDVTCLRTVVVRDKVGYVMRFEPGRSVDWEHSKRFMFGSLLVFTEDDFAGVCFGTVLDRSADRLALGRVTVEMVGDEDGDVDLTQSTFVMVESEVYFEPYQHVLRALQVMTDQDFPMSRYIVGVTPETEPPRYIAEAPDELYAIGEDFKVPVLVDDAWPTAVEMALDESQYRAFKLALTQEFVVIQGPPGTGKTYLGLKIATTIITNIKRILHTANFRRQRARDYAHLQRHSPLLVVCYTNHALDQFLEGLLPTTQNMVRIGGQSKSEVLAPYNLRELRGANRRNGDTFRLSKNIYERMSRLMSKVKGIQQDIECLDTNFGILSVSSIQEACRGQADVSWFTGPTGILDDEVFLDWLVSEEAMYDEQAGDALLPGGGGEKEEAPAAPHEQRGADDDDIDLEDMPADTRLLFCFRVETAEQAAEMWRAAQRRLEEKRDRRSETRAWMMEMNYRRCIYVARRLKDRPRPSADATTELLQRSVNPWHLSEEQRWVLYHAWVSRIRAGLLAEVRRAEGLYRAEAAQYREIRDMDDLELIQGLDVVGMTTTGAARLQPLLQALGCRVVIVEEAAEVMESHIVVSLTSRCEHLILIGDHQQLRPTTAVYRLARDFHLDISLFERMLRNGLHCEVLRVQHRMRPEIARLIVPSIYKELLNHESVLRFEPVRGVAKSVFFLTHDNPEQEIGETHSRRNTLEADMLLRLCRYLLLQGYAAKRITILTTYSGQMFYLLGQRAKSPALWDVKMTIVDNFQGEENDIILLSLVRNNGDNSVGFLKTANRVCVALSRAKHGMFIMGNMDNLLNSGSSVWARIKEALDEQKAVGDFLTLCCPVHNDQLTEVRVVDDFDKVPEGGCLMPCATPLVCGHVCLRVCHAGDREHGNYDCREPCTRTPPGCGLQHPCPKRCGVECGNCETAVERLLPCEHSTVLPCHVDYITYKCPEKVSVTSPVCGHTFVKQCHMDAESWSCPFPCDIRLDCGHTCARTCHAGDDPDHDQYDCLKPCPKTNAGCTREHMCARKCFEECGACCVQVKKKAPTCDHVYTVDCSVDPEDIVCRLHCEKTMACGHPCPLQCYRSCGGCKVMVKKTVEDDEGCNHEVTVECGEPAQRRHCSDPCERLMACGHRCSRPCRVACSLSGGCDELVVASRELACGHGVRVQCKVSRRELAPDEPQLLEHCSQPCDAELQCGHRCEGTCGQCLQGRIHQGCKAKCGRILICGHACSVPCAQACPPCQKKCRMRCIHSRCGRTCGAPCAKCEEPCPWRCPHKRCTRRCWQPCDREPCLEPCEKVLRCDHPCIGYCGEECPRLCRVCDRDEVQTIVFGREDEPDARFVYLSDCKHTIESVALDTWLTQRRDEVSMPQCPLCRSDIMITMRCMNGVKAALKDVHAIKKKIFGEQRAIENGRTNLVARLTDIRPLHMLTPGGEDLFNKLCQQLRVDSRKRVKSRHYNLSSDDLQTAAVKIDILREVKERLDVVRPHTSGVALATLVERTDLLLGAISRGDSLGPQELSDVNLELRRYRRVATLCRLETLTNRRTPTREGVESLIAARAIAFSIGRYSDDLDASLGEAIEQLDGILRANATVDDERERREIVAAVGLSRGHWFKCPQGHYYAIGECGGAMEVGKCPECGAAIGGTRHRLLGDNRLAPEMDGATRSAWPGAAMNL